MALIVEDGTIVNDANAYITVAEARTYADNRGFTLPAADADVEKLIVQATDYTLQFESQYQGSREEPATQELSFPRESVYVYGELINGIPKQLKQAVARLTVDAANGVELQPTTNGQVVTKEKVGELEVEYADTASITGSTELNVNLKAAEALLEPLFKETVAGFIACIDR